MTIEEREEELCDRVDALIKERDQLKEELVSLRGAFTTLKEGTPTSSHIHNLTVVFEPPPDDPRIIQTIETIGKLIERPNHWTKVFNGEVSVVFKCQLYYCIWVVQQLSSRKGIKSVTIE